MRTLHAGLKSEGRIRKEICRCGRILSRFALKNNQSQAPQKISKILKNPFKFNLYP
jgi:hypothetical protein